MEKHTFLTQMKGFVILMFAVALLAGSITFCAKGYYEAVPESVPEWAKQGNFHFIRIDGGRIESWKADRTWWGREFSEEEKEVLSNIYGKYSDTLLTRLSEAGFNWIWVTWSNGWSIREENENRLLLKEFIKRCHENGIRVTAYMSASNMFWESTFKDEPESVTWLLIQNGRPVNYGGPDNPMRFIADVTNPDWRKYLLKKVEMAIAADVDAIFFDNLIGDKNGIEFLFSQVQSAVERKTAKMNKPKILLYGNAHLKPDKLSINDRCELIWNEFGKSTPGVWDEGWYVSNVPKIKFITGAKHKWQPHKYEMDKYHCGPREKCYPDPVGQKLSIAEAWAFGSSLSRNIEGRFLHDLIKGKPAALDAWEAISQYNKFINANKDIFIDVEPVAQVAILSQTGRSASLGGIGENYLAEMLTKENVMFGTKLLSRLHGGMPLTSYKTLLVPGPLAKMSNEEENILLNYVNNGGEIAVLTRNSEKLEDFLEESALSKKVTPITLSPETISSTGKGVPAIDAISKVESLADGFVVKLENEKYVVANVMKKVTEDKFYVHLLNYDHQNPEKNVIIKLNLKGYSNAPDGCKIEILSPDGGDITRFDAKCEDNICEFSVDRIKHYSIAIVTPK